MPGSVTSASGTWTVPAVACGPGVTTTASTWVGVGGLDGGTLLQAGMFDNCIGGIEEQGGFIEEYPGDTDSLDFLVEPGDVVTASVEQTSGGLWSAGLVDDTTGAGETGTIGGYSGGTSAEWFVEDYGNPTYGLSNFGSEQFTNLLVNGTAASVSPSEAWEMVGPSNTVVALPTNPAGGTYRIDYE